MSALLRTSPRILIPDRKRCRDYGVVWLSGGMRGGDKLHDISPRKQHGTLTNGPTWTKGKFGEPGIAVGGGTKRIDIPTSALPLNTGTLCLWLSPGFASSSTSYYSVLDSATARHAYYYGGGDTGRPWVFYNDGRFTTYTPRTFAATDWLCLAWAWNKTGNVQDLYQDGSLLSSISATGTWGSSAIGANVYLGCDVSTSANWPGSFADVSIHNRALTAKQISNLYRNPFYLYRNPPSQFNVGWAAPATTVPGAPTLSMTVSSGTLHFTWTNGATGGTPITGYKLYVGTSSGGESLKYDDVTLTAGMSSYDDSVSISDGTTYWAYLTALNAVGESAASNEVSGTPPGSSPQTITITVASATASASAPTVTPGAATVTMPTASSTAAASSPTVTPGATTVTVTTCSATASASSPTITPTVTIASATASATAAAISPTITAGTSTITVSTAQATASSSAPTITPTVTIVSPTASATASASAPTVTAGATTITVTTGTATAAAIDAGITNATLITPGDATATAAVSALLVIFGSTSIVVGTATGTAAVSSPTIAAGTTTISVGVVSATAGAVVVAVVSGNTAGTSTASVFYVLHGTDTHPIPLLGADPRPHEAAGTSNRFRELKG